MQAKGTTLNPHEGSLRILIDTNIFIAAESVSTCLHPRWQEATRLYRHATELGHTVCVGSGIVADLARHKDPVHRSDRFHQLQRYYRLDPIEVPEGFQKAAGYPPHINAQSRVDLSLLLAIDRGAAHWLVTNDLGILFHATKLGIEEKVLTLTDALEILSLQLRRPIRIPAVEELKGYRINPDDPIFDSFPDEYDMKNWLRNKVGREGRPCLVMHQSEQPLDAIAILKREEHAKWNLPGRVLKICTFKVAEHARGVKRGELLLWSIFQHARANDFDSVFVEVFESEEAVISLFESFGFGRAGTTKRPNELVLSKTLTPPNITSEDFEPLEYNIRYGPGAISPKRWFAVPIIPQWHSSLFPTAEPSDQLTLFDEVTGHGNAIRKAYICNSNTKLLRAGDALLFVRTHESSMANVVGVVEDTIRSTSPIEIMSFTGRRTVYTPDEIDAMCRQNEILAIRFRLDRVLEQPLPTETLIRNKVFERTPMSIQRISNETGIKWINQLALK